MRLAPAVRVPCVAGLRWRTAQAGLVWLATVVGAVWLLRHSGIDARIGLTLALIAAVVAAAAVGWRLINSRPAAATLEWNGARWALLDTIDMIDAPMVELKAVDVMMDLGSWLVLRARSDAGKVRWLTVSRYDAPADFRALCRAAYARGPRAALTLQTERQPD